MNLPHLKLGHLIVLSHCSNDNITGNILSIMSASNLVTHKLSDKKFPKLHLYYDNYKGTEIQAQ